MMSAPHQDSAATGSVPERARRRAGALIIFAALALIAGLVVVAVSAEGRELSRTTSNDGGAWLVNRSISAVAHRNRASGELSSFVRVSDSPTADVHQSGDLVVVHDTSSNQLYEVDTRSFAEDLEPTQLPEFTTVVAVDDAIVVMRTDPLAVWRIDQAELPGVLSLEGIDPLVATEGPGNVAASPDGRIAAIENETGQLWWIGTGGEVSDSVQVEMESDAADLTIVDASAVALSDDGDLFVVGPDQLEHMVRWNDQSATTQLPAKLQQPSATIDSYGPRPATSFALVTDQAQLARVELSNDGAQVQLVGSIPGEQPLAPIVHNDCVYGVVTNPPTFGVACDDFFSQPLSGAGANLRLRLVNGWVWVNDVDSGTAYSTDENLEFEEFDDWGPAQEIAEEIEEDTSGDIADSADGPFTDDPDADGSVQDSDDFDPSELNEPPVAVDDVTRTRVDRSVVVDVLDNDTDANNDILVVTSVEPISGQGRISVTPSGAAVQVSPAAGFEGTVQLRYSITDGKSDPVSALVTVEVVSIEAVNRPPDAVTDVIATAPGHTTTVDVLRNDSDPDGDAIALTGITTDTGTLRWDPIGQVTFTPDNTTEAGWIELPYVVADDLGLEADGLLRVEIRDDGANQEPDARNDQATTVVGRAVVIDLLANDSDPDGDPLIVGSQPRLLSPVNAVVQTSTTSDGEFVFRSENPGTYLFSYTVNDAAPSGSESDTARIRVDVLPDVQNLPPVAVRDDVVIATGETRTVYALANDGDPDGDLVSIVDWQTSDGLQVTEFDDGTGHVGFQITIEPGQVVRPTMTYWISDGVNDPVSAPIVIAVVQRTATDQPPFANDDVIEARAGSAVSGIRVLANDFDPEAGPLRVVRVGDADDADITIGEDEQSLDLVIAPDTVSSFSVPYDIEDQAGNRAGAVMRVQLINANAPNRPPIARTDQARTKRGEPILIDVLRNDSDPDNDVIALEAINAQPTNGVAEITAQGAVRYQPGPDFAGTDVLRYSIVDSLGDRAIGDVFIGVREDIDANLAPIANDDAYTLAGSSVATRLDVLANDFDPEGDPLQVIDVTTPTHGSVILDDFGRVEYLPPTSLAEAVTSTFDYVIVDTADNPARATVSITLEAFEAIEEPTPDVPEAEVATTPTPVPTVAPEPDAGPTPTPTPTPDDEENLAPIAVNDERGPVRAGTQIDVAVLENDRDPDGERSELSILSVGDGGVINGDIVTVTTGDETTVIPYTIQDAFGATGTATITVVVIENQGPSVLPLTVNTAFETAISIDVSGQAIDPDDDPLGFVCCEDIRGGAVSNVVTGEDTFQLVFTPDDDFVGQGGFNYRVDDREGHQVSGNVTVTVADPDNRAPTTVANTVSIPQGETVAIDLAALTSDPDGDTLTYTLLSEPGSGVSVQLSGATAAVTVDRETAIGSAGSFAYEVSDGVLNATGTVTLEVSEGANRPPVASDYSEDVPGASSTTVNLASLTVEPDPGDFAVYTTDGDTSGEGVVVTLNGSVMQISPPVSAIGETVPITYTATDSRGDFDTGVITITVVAPTQPDPTTSPDTGEVERNASVTIAVLDNDSDPLGQGLTLETLSTAWGTATNVSNELQFNPGDRTGTATVTYTMVDAANRQATGTATIEVIGAPEQPSPPDVTRGSTEVAITWIEPADNGRTIDGYRIFSSAGGDPEVVGRQSSHTWEGLDNGTEYTFTVQAFNVIGDSPESDPSIPVTPDELPEIPGPPTATRLDGELFVEWQEPTNLGSDIDRYELQIGPLQVPPEPIVGRLNHTWPDLENGEFYTFTVRAHNAAGWTDWSQPSEERRPSAPPDPLTIGTTTRGTDGGALTVNWTNNDTNGADILEYEIESSAVPGGSSETDPLARSYDWTELPPGVDMTFTVRARNEAGWSQPSAESNVMQACAEPSAPTAVTPVRGNTEVALTWTAPPDTQDCSVLNYIVRSYRNGVLDATQNSDDAIHTFTGLTNGLDYTFTAQPTNVIGIGTESAESIEVRPAGPPICPTGTASFIASIDAPREIDLSWSNLAANNGAPIIDYEIDSGSGFQPLGSAAESTSFGSLANGTQYNYSIRAVNAVDSSDTCLSVSATTWALPSPVTSVVGSFDGASETIGFQSLGGWSDFVPGFGQTLTVFRDGVEVTLSQVAGSGVPGTDSRIFTVTEDGNYTATFEACNVAGCVQRTSAPENVTLAAPPEQMTASNILLTSTFDSDIYATQTGMRITVDFVEPNDNGADITTYRYDVRRTDPVGGGWWTVRDNQSFPANQSSTISRLDQAAFFAGYSSHPQGLNLGQPITWQVRARARNDKGLSIWSDWVSITPPRPTPTLNFTVSQYRDCTPGGQTIRIQCHDINVEMYGFPPNRTYDFRSPLWPSGSPNPNAAPQWQQTGGPAARWEHDCIASVLTRTDATGRVAGNAENCLSHLGASVRLSSNDGYFSPWRAPG